VGLLENTPAQNVGGRSQEQEISSLHCRFVLFFCFYFVFIYKYNGKNRTTTNLTTDKIKKDQSGVVDGNGNAVKV
jgi:hypothetical protein